MKGPLNLNMDWNRNIELSLGAKHGGGLGGRNRRGSGFVGG